VNLKIDSIQSILALASSLDSVSKFFYNTSYIRLRFCF